MGTRHGLALIAGTLVMTLGLVFLAVAGKRREREQASGAAASERSGFGVGLIICILSGVFSSMLNFAFVFGEEMRQLSLQAGASTAMSGNGIWALAVSCGFLPNAAYCIYLLNKNHTWGVFREKAAGAGYALGAALMGVLWYSGVVVYGMGADALGTLGGIVGWPVYMSVDIIAGIALGIPGRRMERRQPHRPELLPDRDRHPLPRHRRDQLGQRIVKAALHGLSHSFARQ